MLRHLVAGIVDRNLEAVRSGISIAFELGQRRNVLDLLDVAAWRMIDADELQVLDPVCSGLTNTQVAARLHVSLATVKTHVAHIFTKVGVPNRATLIAEAHARR